MMMQEHFMIHIGADVEEERPGYCRLSLKIDRHHMNSLGTVHGGVPPTLMDTAAGRAIELQQETMSEEPFALATVEMNVSYLRPLHLGDELVVEATLLRLGRRLAVAEAEARPRGGDLAAKGRFTFAILKKDS